MKEKLSFGLREQKSKRPIDISCTNINLPQYYISPEMLSLHAYYSKIILGTNIVI